MTVKKSSIVAKIVVMASVFVLSFHINERVYGNAEILRTDGTIDKSTEEKICEMAKCVNPEIDVCISDNISMYNVDENILFDVYPLISDGECVMLAQVCDGEVSVSSDLYWYEKFQDNLIDDDKHILYVDNGKIYLENKRDTVELEDVITTDKNKTEVFYGICFEDKVNIIEDCDENVVNFEKTDNILYGVDDEDEDLSEDVDEDMLYGLEYDACNITKFVKQGPHNLCWAACVATIANYKKNKNYTAKQIADKMGIGYETGATTGQTKDALSMVKVNNYSVKNSKISWGLLRKRISKNNRPFIIAIRNASLGGHMVTAYGYLKGNDGVKRVSFWDPNNNKTAFEYGNYLSLYGYSWRWCETVY